MAAQRITSDECRHHRRRRRRIHQPRAERARQQVPHPRDDWIVEHKPEIYMPMIETAENVAKRYNVSREAQDEYALREPAPHRRRPAGRQVRRRDRAADGPKKIVLDKAGRGDRQGDVTLDPRRGQPRRHHAGGPRQAQAASMGESGFITAGNASQLSDGASACVVMDAKTRREARTQAARHLPRLRGRRLRARRDGHRPGVRGAASCSQRIGLKVDDIGLWELNEAFAVQVVYCRDRLGIPDGAAQRQRRRDRRSAIPTA